MNTFHTRRAIAQKEYDAALANQRRAEVGDSEAAYFTAKAILDEKRTALLAMEQRYPTAQESRRAANRLRLGNRGLEI